MSSCRRRLAEVVGGADERPFVRDPLEAAQQEPASTQILREAVLAIDLAEQCRAAIQRDGVMLRTKVGYREHPCCKIELSARSLGCRTLQRLGLDLEDVGAPGRPPGQRGG